MFETMFSILLVVRTSPETISGTLEAILVLRGCPARHLSGKKGPKGEFGEQWGGQVLPKWYQNRPQNAQEIRNNASWGASWERFAKKSAKLLKFGPAPTLRIELSLVRELNFHFFTLTPNSHQNCAPEASIWAALGLIN